MSTHINRDEWLEALGEANRPAIDPMALTIKELGKLLHLSERQARRSAERLIEQGKALPASKWVVDEYGNQRRVHAIKLKKT